MTKIKNATRHLSSRSKDTRTRILHAARALFAERGFTGTTTKAIAQKARVNEALIFRHFPAKQDLYESILRDKLADESLFRIVASAEDRTLRPDEALRQVAQRFSEYSDPEFLRLYFHSALENHPLAPAFYDAFVDRLIRAVEQVIRRGIRKGVFRKMNPSVAAIAFTAALRNHCLTCALFPAYAEKTSHLNLPSAVADLLLQGFAAT